MKRGTGLDSGGYMNIDVEKKDQGNTDCWEMPHNPGKSKGCSSLSLSQSLLSLLGHMKRRAELETTMTAVHSSTLRTLLSHRILSNPSSKGASALSEYWLKNCLLEDVRFQIGIFMEKLFWGQPKCWCFEFYFDLLKRTIHQQWRVSSFMVKVNW